MRAPALPLLSCVFALALCASSPAVAQPADSFEARFQRGIVALEEMRYAEACDAFEAAYRERQTPRVLYNLALALRGAGRYRRAIASFEQYVAAPDPGDAPARIARVQETADEMRRALVRVRVRLDPATAALTVDGRVEAMENNTLTLDPGAHVFEATAADRVSFRREMRLDAGAEVTLDATLAEAPPSGRLMVVPSVASALVRIDGALVATGSVDRVVAPGEHRVEIQAREYVPFVRVVRVGRTGVVRVDATLVAPPRNNWLLPTAVVGGVALVAGSVALIAWVARPSEPYVIGNWGELRE